MTCFRNRLFQKVALWRENLLHFGFNLYQVLFERSLHVFTQHMMVRVIKRLSPKVLGLVIALESHSGRFIHLH